MRSACGPASAGASSLSVFVAEPFVVVATGFGEVNAVAVGPKLNAGRTTLPVVEACGSEGSLGGARGASGPKLNADPIGFDGVVDVKSVLLLASCTPDFSGESVLPNAKPKVADVALGLGAKEKPVLGVGGLSVDPMLKENVGNLLGVVEAVAEGVDGALKRKEDAPVLEEGDGTTMVSAIAGFTVGLMAKMLDCFEDDDGVAGVSFSAIFSVFCSSIRACANRLARLEGRFSVVSAVVPPAVEAAAPNVGNGTDDTPAPAVEVVGEASFFSAVGPKLKPANGEGFAGALSVDGNVGLNPAGPEPLCGVLLAVELGNLKPPTAGKPGFALSDCAVGNTGLNPLAVEDDVEDDGGGSLNPPALGMDGGGAGIESDGLLASEVFLFGGSILEESSIAAASRFFV